MAQYKILEKCSIIYLFCDKLSLMRESWSYDKEKHFDNKGNRWHFVRRDFFDSTVDYGERPYELYFRDDEKTEFGLLRFEKSKDNPYRNYETLIKKIMNN